MVMEKLRQVVERQTLVAECPVLAEFNHLFCVTQSRQSVIKFMLYLHRHFCLSVYSENTKRGS